MVVKYPLTPEAKETARQLVQAWDAGKLYQQMYIIIPMGMSPRYDRGLANADAPPALHILKELSLFDLVKYEAVPSSMGGERYSLLLLQELRNAVTCEFTVSDYFLTLNAVGNIIINSSTGPVQGIGINEGTAHQTVTALADDIEARLGQDFLKSQADLKQAIDELRTAVKGNEQSKLGKVILQLGRSLEHGANAAAVTVALTLLIMYLQRGG